MKIPEDKERVLLDRFRPLMKAVGDCSLIEGLSKDQTKGLRRLWVRLDGLRLCMGGIVHDVLPLYEIALLREDPYLEFKQREADFLEYIFSCLKEVMSKEGSIPKPRSSISKDVESIKRSVKERSK